MGMVGEAEGRRYRLTRVGGGWLGQHASVFSRNLIMKKRGERAKVQV